MDKAVLKALLIGVLICFAALGARAQPFFNFPGPLSVDPRYSVNDVFDVTPDETMAAVIGSSESGPVGASQVAVIDTRTGFRYDTKIVQTIGAAISVKFAVLSDGIKLLVMSDNNNGSKFLTIYDVSSAGVLTLRAHTQLNNDPGVSTQGSNIVYSRQTRSAFAAVLSGTNRLYSVDIDTGLVRQTVAAGIFDNLNLFEDGTRRIIVSGGLRRLIFVDYTNPSMMQVFPGISMPDSSPSFGTNTYATAFTGDGNYVFAGSGSSLLSTVDTATRQVVASLNNSRYRIGQMRMHETPTSRFLLVRGWEDGGNALKGYAAIDVQNPLNPTLAGEVVLGEDAFRTRSLTISRNGRRALIGFEGRLKAFSFPQLVPIWEVPLPIFESIKLMTIRTPEKIFGAWQNRIYTFPNFTNRASNFDLDGKSDIAVFRPSTNTWHWLRSVDGATTFESFGKSGDVPVPADYDGDDKTDLAVYRPALGEWSILDSSTGTIRTVDSFRTVERPVPADYDGDGKADIAVFRKYPNRWVVLKSMDGQLLTRKERFGNVIPVVGDFDGDEKADFASFLNGVWQLTYSSSGATESLTLGGAGDIAFAGDFDNDGRSDPTVFEPSTRTWRIQQSYGGPRTVQFGQNLDVPVPADYDGDNKVDLAVFRPATSTWQILQSSNNITRTVQFGTSGDFPLLLRTQ